MPPTKSDRERRPLLQGGGRFLRGALHRRITVHLGKKAGLAAILAFCVALAVHRAAGQTQESSPPPAMPGARPFQPGVQIDWASGEVRVDGHVVLREGPIEFLACLPGKEHESIVRLDASAMHIYLALGLIGLEPGHPVRWQENAGRFEPATGDLVDVSIEWQAREHRQSVPAFDWLREFTYARTPIDRPWVFAGSRRLPDGTLSADHGGDGLAIVDKPDSLLALSRTHSDRDAELWAEANTPAIPPLGTAVQLVLRPAKPRAYEIRVDFRGAAFVNGRYASRADLADLIALARQLSPDYVQRIRLEATLHSDTERLRQALTAAGLPAEAMDLVRCASAASAPGRERLPHE